VRGGKPFFHYLSFHHDNFSWILKGDRYSPRTNVLARMLRTVRLRPRGSTPPAQSDGIAFRGNSSPAKWEFSSPPWQADGCFGGHRFSSSRCSNGARIFSSSASLPNLVASPKRPARRARRHPDIEDVLARIIFLFDAAHQVARTADPQPFARAPLLAIGIGGNTQAHWSLMLPNRPLGQEETGVCPLGRPRRPAEQPHASRSSHTTTVDVSNSWRTVPFRSEGVPT
jgi:hypothetical protein